MLRQPPVDALQQVSKDVHKKAYAAVQAKSALLRKALLDAEAKAGPLIMVPDMTATGALVERLDCMGLEKLIPSNKYPAMHEEYKERLIERRIARDAIYLENLGCDDDGAFTQEEDRAELLALQELTETIPTTLQGLSP